MKKFFYVLCSALLILIGLILVEQQTVDGKVKLFSFMRSKEYRIGFEHGRKGRTTKNSIFYHPSYRKGWLEGRKYYSCPDE